VDLTTIAFIECTLKGEWKTIFGFPNLNNNQTWSQHKAEANDCEVNLVDIKNDRRYFRFRSESTIQIVNNVISFNSPDAEELAVDESKKFPTKQQIGQ